MEKVEVVTETGLTLVLPIATSPTGYVVKDIDGLDPNKAILVGTIISSVDGEEEQSARGERRTILMKLGYALSHPSTVRARRVGLYRYLMPKSKVLLRFYMPDFPVVEIKATVESLDAPQFTKDPEANITLVAFKPDFIAKDLTVVPGFTTENPEGMTIEYGGSNPSGFLFKMGVDRVLPGFSINQNQANGVGSTLMVLTPLQAGDLVEINTQDGMKGAWRTRAGVRTSILNGVAPASDWIDLQPGSNTLRVYAAGAPIPWTLEYKARFGGI